MRFRFLLVLMVLLVACNSSDNQGPESSLQGANQERRSATLTLVPTATPTVAVAEASVGSELRVQNVPTNVSGDLYLTLDTDLYHVSLDGEAAEVVLSDAAVSEIRDSMVYYSLENEDGSRGYYTHDLETETSHKLFDVAEGQLARFRQWSPDNQWFVVEIGQYDERMINAVFIPTQFIDFDVLETRVYNIDGTPVAFPEPEVTDGLRYSALFTTQSTLLIRAQTTRVGHLFTLWHFDQNTNTAATLELDASAQLTIDRVFNRNFFGDGPINMVNASLAEYGIELFPPAMDMEAPFVVSADEAFRIEIEQSNTSSSVCQDFFVMQEPEQDVFLPRQLGSFQALQVSEPFLANGRVLMLRIVSRTCTFGDLALELAAINNLDDPAIETLYQAEYSFNAGFPTLNYLTTPDMNYLFWSTIEAERVILLLTDINSGETHQIMALPYEPPNIEEQQIGTSLNLLAISG
ncbi:MAG: hypothetical protein L0154_20220 [Chloroflexi bacterium]|nr:hypothetical protein [Chloroflexota bacterium]